MLSRIGHTLLPPGYVLARGEQAPRRGLEVLCGGRHTTCGFEWEAGLELGKAHLVQSEVKR